MFDGWTRHDWLCFISFAVAGLVLNGAAVYIALTGGRW